MATGKHSNRTTNRRINRRDYSTRRSLKTASRLPAVTEIPRLLRLERQAIQKQMIEANRNGQKPTVRQISKKQQLAKFNALSPEEKGERVVELTAKYVRGGSKAGEDDEEEGQGEKEEGDDKNDDDDEGGVPITTRHSTISGDLTMRNHPTNSWAGPGCVAPPSPRPNPISSTPFVLRQRVQEDYEEEEGEEEEEEEEL